MDDIKVPPIIPCSKFKAEHIWHQTFPFLKSESVMATIDANGDSFLDIIVGFSTGINYINQIEHIGTRRAYCDIFSTSQP